MDSKERHEENIDKRERNVCRVHTGREVVLAGEESRTEVEKRIKIKNYRRIKEISVRENLPGLSAEETHIRGKSKYVDERRYTE